MVIRWVIIQYHLFQEEKIFLHFNIPILSANLHQPNIIPPVQSNYDVILDRRTFLNVT